MAKLKEEKWQGLGLTLYGTNNFIGVGDIVYQESMPVKSTTFPPS